MAPFPLDSRDEQKKTREMLSSLLYKKGYCLCIPDPGQVELLLNKVDKSWIQTFLLEKNPVGFSIVSMFILILIKNKQLNVDERQRLLAVICLLLDQLENSAIDLILLEKKDPNSATIYCLIQEQRLFEQVASAELKKSDVVRIQSLTRCLEMLVEKKNREAITLAPEDATLLESAPAHLNCLSTTLFKESSTIQSFRKSFFAPLRNYFNLFKPCFGLKDSEVATLEINERSPLIKHAF
ncbi:MAG: hypothetical protein V4471_01615 [Pseudomonadota bacterium]